MLAARVSRLFGTASKDFSKVVMLWVCQWLWQTRTRFEYRTGSTRYNVPSPTSMSRWSCTEILSQDHLASWPIVLLKILVATLLAISDMHLTLLHRLSILTLIASSASARPVPCPDVSNNIPWYVLLKLTWERTWWIQSWKEISTQPFVVRTMSARFQWRVRVVMYSQHDFGKATTQ